MDRKTGIIKYTEQILLAVFLGLGFTVLMPPLKLWDNEFLTKYDFYIRFCVVAASGLLWLWDLWREKELDPFTGVFIVFCGLIPAVTFFQNGNLKQAIWSDMAVPLACLFLLSVGCKRREDVTVRVLYVLYYAFSLVNLVTCFVDLNAYLGAGEHVFFFGNRNLHIYFYLIPLYCGFYGLQKDYLQSRLLYLLYYVLCLVAVVKAGGLTAKVVLCIWGAFLLFQKREMLRRLTSPLVTVVFNFAVFLFLQVYTLSSTTFLKQQLEKFGKSASFSGRTPIWKEIQEAILEAPLFGHGAVDMTALFGVRHAHNIYLQILYTLGILGILVLLVLLLLLYRKLERQSCRQLALLMQVLLCCVLLGGQFDVGYLQYYAVYGGLIYYVSSKNIQ